MKLSDYVNASYILASDPPAVVVRKLQAAIDGKSCEACATCSAPTSTRDRLPEGWRVEIEGDTALVVAPQNGPGGLVVCQNSGPLADRLLFALVKSLTE